MNFVTKAPLMQIVKDAYVKRRAILEVDHVQHSSLTNGYCIGRTRVSENQLHLSNIGVAWGTLTSTTSADYKCAMSSDGKIILSASYGGKPAISYDGGLTWNETYGSIRNHFGAAMSADGKIMMLTDFGNGLILCSYDYGATWAEKKTSIGTGVRYCAMSSDGRVMAAMVQGGYIWVSVDFGENWTQVASSKSWTGLCMSSDGKYMMACAQDSSAEYIYMSYNYGTTWTAITGAGTASWSQARMSADGRVIVTSKAGGRVYMSYDYGATWASKDTADRSWREFAMTDSGKIIIGCDDNYVFVSINYGETWTQTTRAAGNSQALCITSDGKKMLLSCNYTDKYVSYADSTVEGNFAVQKRLLGSKGANVASANDITLGEGNFFDITGNTQIQRILTSGWTAGSRIILRFNDSIEVANDTAGGSGYAGIDFGNNSNPMTFYAGGHLDAMYDGTKWHVIVYWPNSAS